MFINHQRALRCAKVLGLLAGASLLALPYRETLMMMDAVLARDLELSAQEINTLTESDSDAPLGSSAVAPSAFGHLALAPELLQAVADLGFTQPTAVQQATIPRAMAGLASAGGQFTDLMVSSQTGSGKTAAFLLPVLHTLLKQQREQEERERAQFARLTAEALARGEAAPKRPKRKDPTNPRHFKAATPGALILCPTRELAQQVCADAIDLVRHCRGLRIANVVGGMPYPLQIAKLQNANLVVATPGRLLDLQRSMQIKLDQVSFLVVDEADRMLDLGFADDLAEIHQLTHAREQTMMFSATFAPRIMQLATRVMREPQRIEIDTPQDKHLSIKQTLHWADNLEHKRKLLDHWLRDTSIAQAVVFASTQIECDGLANDLVQDGFHAVALHGALSQGLRNRRLSAFREGRVQILVATDVAARGLDVPSISHVINFGLPMKAEDYVHRIGRTGRAGRSGEAITIAEFRDRRRIADIEHYTRQAFKPSVIAGLEPRQRFPSSFEQRPPRSGPGGRPPARGAAPRSGQGMGWGGERNFADRGARRVDPRREDARRDEPRRDDRQFASRDRSPVAPVPGATRRERSFDPRFEGRGDGFAPRPDFARPPGGGREAGRKPGRFAR